MELHNFLQQNPLKLGTESLSNKHPDLTKSWSLLTVIQQQELQARQSQIYFFERPFNVLAANISKHFKLVMIKHKIHGLKRRNK